MNPCKPTAGKKWQTISETASEGLTNRLSHTLTSSYGHKSQLDAMLSPSISIPGIGSISLGQTHVSSQQAPLSLREALLETIKHNNIKKEKVSLLPLIKHKPLHMIIQSRQPQQCSML